MDCSIDLFKRIASSSATCCVFSLITKGWILSYPGDCVSFSLSICLVMEYSLKITASILPPVLFSRIGMSSTSFYIVKTLLKTRSESLPFYDFR